MGLDMYIYSVKKAELSDSIVYDESIIGDRRHMLIPEDEIDLPGNMQLKPYCTKIRTNIKYIDEKKICEDFGLHDLKVDGFWDGCMHFSEGYRGEPAEKRKQDIAIHYKDIDREYTLVKEENRYVCELEEVKYWRKAYGVQDWIHEALECRIDNCGFYFLNEEFIQNYNERFPDNPIEEDDECALFYQEWY